MAARAGEKRPTPPYKNGVLLAMSDNPREFIVNGANGTAPLMVHSHHFMITIAVDDLAYTGDMGRTYIKDAIIGDPIKASADDKYLYFLTPAGRPLRVTISQRARYKPKD